MSPTLSAFVLLLVSACADPRPRVAASSPPALSLPPGAADVAAFRGHAFTRSIPVLEVTRARLRHVLEAEQKVKHFVSDENEAFLKGFGFIPLGTTLSESASVRLQAEALVGLYVPHERTVYVRPRTRTSEAASSEDVLHELGHALQDDVFGIDAMYAAPTDDERLARHAVYEGDATVVAWGAAARRTGHSEREAISEGRVLASAQSSTLGVALDLGEVSGWESAPRLVRVEMGFPYSAGTELAADAYLAGGTALMDGLFRKPPISTEQVLHPVKYFRGELPIPVASPQAPAGFRVVAHGTMGELRTRAFLELGLPTDGAVAASGGWGGDAYAVVAREDGKYPPLAVVWSTVWDDEARATKFATALEQATRGGGDLGHVALRREGTRVAWTRGLDAAPGELETLLTLPGPKPADRAPHGEVLLPSVQTAREILVPAGGDPNLVLPSLGLRARLPRRYASIRSKRMALLIRQVDERGTASIARETRPYDAAAFASAAESVAAVFAGGTPLDAMQLMTASLPLGPAKVAVWKFSDGQGEARLVAVPICEGKQTILITIGARGEEARVALDQWLRSLEPTGPEPPPACTDGPPVTPP